ncbi:MAG: amidase, partial [Pseudomonadota bacterium]|nr:amidase [Pseudomonadota bacterium]
ITILEVEAAAAFEELTLTDRDEELIAQGPSNWPNRMRQWRFTPAIELIQAERIRLQVMESMHKIYEQVDVILAPSFSPLLLITNMTGHPSLTLRAGFIQSKARGSARGDVPADRIPDNRTDTEHRVPHGITLCGRLFEEGRLLNLGTALESFFGVWRERPPVG